MDVQDLSSNVDRLGVLKATIASTSVECKKIEEQLKLTFPEGGSIEGSLFRATVIPPGGRSGTNWELLAYALAAHFDMKEADFGELIAQFSTTINTNASVRVYARNGKGNSNVAT